MILFETADNLIQFWALTNKVTFRFLWKFYYKFPCAMMVLKRSIITLWDKETRWIKNDIKIIEKKKHIYVVELDIATEGLSGSPTENTWKKWALKRVKSIHSRSLAVGSLIRLTLNDQKQNNVLDVISRNLIYNNGSPRSLICAIIPTRCKIGASCQIMLVW